jgi:predicted Fe-Mo cluster-binding NifX family protein
MKIAITSEGTDVDAAVDPRFGRCKYFLIFDLENACFEVIENSHAQASGGAGIQAGQQMVSKGVSAVLTGHVGPNAAQILTPAGIKIHSGITGKVSEVLERFKSGDLKTA